MGIYTLALTPPQLISGVVSSSTTGNGGYVHGIVPQALLGRAAEHTPAPAAPGSQAANATPAAVSSEGTGKDLLEDDAGGHLTMDVVDSMHEVSWSSHHVRTS